MPLRDLVIAVSLIVSLIAIAFIAWLAGSEFYIFLPGRAGLHLPPSSPWIILIVLSITSIVFLFARRYAAIILTAFAMLVLLGLPTGYLIFEWIPGISHYLLVIGFGILVAYVWSNDYLNED